MTLEEAVASIGLRQVDGLSMVRSQTGELYTVIVSGGLKPEGHTCPIFCATEELATKFWLDAFNEYAKDKNGTIYWRVRPQMGLWMMHEEQDKGREFGYKVYTVYSRLLISDKAVLPRDHELVESYYDDMAKRAA